MSLGDLAFTVLGVVGPTVALWVISALTGVAMLVIWRYTSNQTAIADVRRTIAAHLLATRLFKDNLSVTFAAQRQIIGQAVRLMGHSLRPMLIMTIPFVLVMVQVGLRYEHRPFDVGQSIRLQATVKRGVLVAEAARDLVLPAGLIARPNDPCRVQPLRTIDWRLTPAAAGDYTLRFGSEGGAVEMPLRVGGGFVRVSACRGGAWLNRLLYSAEPSIPDSSPFEEIRICNYPRRSTPIFGLDVHWLITLLVLSIVFALLFKPFLKVHI